MGTSAARLTIPRRFGLGRTHVLFAAVSGVFLFSLLASGILLARVALPATEAIARRTDKLAALAGSTVDLDARSKIYSADGKLLAILHGEENREPVWLGKVPMHVRKAVIAIEDKRFYTHDGVDLTALGRALVVNAAGRQIEQGGGTITMQLARNVYLHNKAKTIARKWDEIVVARRLEERFTKDQILGDYLNTVYFGRGAYGIQAAAEAFFGTTAPKLTLAQGALLAGLIRAPDRLDPRRHRADALARRAQVLRAMRSQEMITDAQLTAATKDPMKLVPSRVSNGIVMHGDVGASFVEYVKQQLLADVRLGATPQERTARVFGGGLRITTTLDLTAQRAAERSIAAVLDRKSDPSAGLASIEPDTGAIRAMAGAISAQGFNFAAQARRQPGSAFKPFTLVAAIEKGMSLYKGFSASAPRMIKLDNGTYWRVRNYEGSPSGYMNVLEATRSSVNAVYAQMVMEVGPEKVVDVAHRMGITSPLDAYPSISLGALNIGVTPLEMASAYATLANGGTAYAPYAVAKVTDRAGKVLWTTEPKGIRALEPDVANKARAVLEQVIERGTGTRARRLGRPAGGKTGTTDFYKDSWFAGFTPQLSTAVWLGYPTPRPLDNIHGLRHVYGGSLPCEIWTRYMTAALAGETVMSWPDVSLGGGDIGGGDSGGDRTFVERRRSEPAGDGRYEGRRRCRNGCPDPDD
jgi:penicillin-binding protein 1A